MSIKERLQSRSSVIFIGLLLTVIVLIESIFPPWAPYFIVYALLALIIPVILKTFNFGSIRQVFSSHWKLILVIFLISLIIDQGIFTFLYNQILAALGLASNPYYSLSTAINSLGEAAATKFGISTDTALLIYAGFIILWAPIGEELFYRGFMQGVLRRFMGFTAAALISGVFFGVRHMTHLFFLWPNFPLVAALIWAASAFVYGLLMSYLYEKTKSLYAVILVHAVLNIIGFLLSI